MNSLSNGSCPILLTVSFCDEDDDDANTDKGTLLYILQIALYYSKKDS